MTITFVTKDQNKPERWKRLNLGEKEKNPFKDIVKEGEQIPIDDLLNFIIFPYCERGGNLREIQKFCLYATIDKYTDIRYYLDHGQN